MKEYLSLRLKKMEPLFLVPMLVEVVFLFLRIANPRDNILPYIHDTWYIAAAAVLLFATSHNVLKMYYVGSDQVLAILPFTNELLTGIEICFYTLFSVLFGLMFRYVNLYGEKEQFSFWKYASKGTLLLLWFYAILFCCCALFKNISKPLIGKSLILLSTIAVIILEEISFNYGNHQENLTYFITIVLSISVITFLKRRGKLNYLDLEN
ncbi:hypothetical protein PT285_03905 [Lactobacillus sp. ESL0791]|uniref:hypothetical protein n=1 Tax=Lactobacillus sp. ESL0791 TaxID=2983234 RepID=UPI0023F69367|nr:hypothetical protein [Lactobacillus sp. ESL0791]MDF7638554.1 hypothetical protein [Lactobacillus sp. ESL0791]